MFLVQINQTRRVPIHARLFAHEWDHGPTHPLCVCMGHPHRCLHIWMAPGATMLAVMRREPMEQVAFEVLCERQPQPKARKALRLTAVVGVGVFRVAMEVWRNEKGRRHLTKHIEDAFAALPDVL